MRRIYFICFLRKFLSPVTVKAGLLVYGFFHLSFYVSYLDVVKNAGGGRAVANYDYWWQAFTHTELLVQVMVSAVIAMTFWLLYDAYINLRPKKKFKLFPLKHS